MVAGSLRHVTIIVKHDGRFKEDIAS